jgi:hypothetical protein
LITWTLIICCTWASSWTLAIYLRPKNQTNKGRPKSTSRKASSDT